MNMLFDGYLACPNDFELNYHLKPYPDLDELSIPFSPVEESSSSSEGEISQEIHVPEPELLIDLQNPNIMLSFIGEMLMKEEDLDNKPCMLRDCLALQATEKSLLDVLHNNQSPDPNSQFSSNQTSSSETSPNGFFPDYNWNQERDPVVMESNFPALGYSTSQFSNSNSSDSQLDANSRGRIEEITQFLLNDDDDDDELPAPQSEKKNRNREDENDLFEMHRSNKLLASDVDEYEPLEMYDEALLCMQFDRLVPCCIGAGKTIPTKQLDQKKKSKGLSNGGKPKEVVDLRSLLMQCAQAVANYDTRTINDLLARLRTHSSPHGDGNERLAHYFANALEARVAGTGPISYAGFHSKRAPASQILKAYSTFTSACPFRYMSNVMANRTIYKLAVRSEATTLHIIDFGILYGYQWPCLIQRLSARPGGPPKLRITGIDFPQPGFRPAERVADTGKRLKRYSDRFGVPFEYNAIAKKWETITIEDLKVVKNELLVVNTLYRLQNVPDETNLTTETASPRDIVVNLIKEINPNIFIHGTVNGTYNTPFFVTRFREAFFQYSSMFDMLEETWSNEDEYRVMYEREILGRDVMNIIACEGTERVERPETYKQWQGKFKRAGFKQMSLDQEIFMFVRESVKLGYNKNFSVDGDGKWMLQGWKGRVSHAFSIWQPTNM